MAKKIVFDHGGKREGAGRAPYVSPDLKKVGLYVKLPQWLVNWLAEQEIGSRAELIEKALRRRYKLSPPDDPAPPPDPTPPPSPKRRRK